MNPRSRGKEEMAFIRARIEIERIFNEAMESGVNTDDLIYCAYYFVTRGTGYQIQAKATRESVFELRLKSSPQNGEPPVSEVKA